MTLKRAILPLFLLILLFSAINTTSATSYYNWIENYSFNPTANWIEDHSFESGSFLSGTTYGNFSTSGGFINTTDPNTGLYHGWIASGGANYIRYTFASTYQPLVDDIEAFNVTMMTYYGPNDFQYTITYTDASSDSDSLTITPDEEYVEFDLLQYMDSGKTLDWVAVYPDVTQIYTDDWECIVDDGNGQNDISFNSAPWVWGGTYSGLANAPEIVTNFGYDDSYSCRMGQYPTYKILQTIDYVPASAIEYIDLYVYTALNSTELETYPIGITVSVVYSDSTSDSKTKYLETGEGWEHLNFGSIWLDDTKYIVQFRINLYDTAQTNEQIVYIDYIGLWAETGSAGSRFVWQTSPTGSNKQGNYVELYQDTTYTFYGYVYNASGSLTQNGTATITSSKGQTTANISLGLFNFTFSPRTSTGDLYEDIGLVMALDDPEVLVANIQILWRTGGSSGGVTPTTDIDSISDFLGIFLVCFFPAMALGGGMASNQETKSLAPMGFIAGLIMGVTIGVITGFIPSWALIFCAMGVIILIWSMKH